MAAKKLAKKKIAKKIGGAAKKVAKKPVKKEKAVKIKETGNKLSFGDAENLMAKITGVKFLDAEIGDKIKRIGSNKSGVTVVGCPDRGEFILKVDGKNVCEIYPRKGGYRICTNSADSIKLPKDTNILFHENWGMKQEFKVLDTNFESVINQFSELRAAK